jgi:hypothetical protein
MQKRKYQIFVSSTYLDLVEERQAAVEEILKAGHIPAGMELFAAGDESQMETIRRWIETSDIYMLILGGRYGSTEANTGLSYIELEYDYAASLNKPIFAVIMKPAAIDNKVRENGMAAIEREHHQQYEEFKKKVLSKTCSFFEDQKDIRLSIHESIPDIQGRHELVGWVPGSEVQDNKPLLAEINRLSEENSELREEAARLKKQLEPSVKRNQEEEFTELADMLSRVEIETTAFSGNGEGKQTHSLFGLFYDLRDILITGVANHINIGAVEKLLYYNVCPKLQIHGLMVNESVPGVAFRRFSITKKGVELLQYLERNELLSTYTGK